VKRITHHRLTPRLRMTGVLPSLHHMPSCSGDESSTRTTLRLPRVNVETLRIRQEVVSHTDKTRRGESPWQDRTCRLTVTRQDVPSHTDETRRGESHRQERMWCHTNKTGHSESLWQDMTWWVTPTRQDVVSHSDKTRQDVVSHTDKTGCDVTPTRQDVVSHSDKTGRQLAPVRTTKYNQSRRPVKVDVRSIASVTILRRRKRLQRHRRYLFIPLIKLTHFTALIILGVECSSRSASQCNFTQSPVNC
jgi:hypothetical protein